MSLCEKSKMLGEPNKGAHKTRIPCLNVALVDVALTVLAAWIIAKVFKLNFWAVLFFLFVASIVAHRAFCVRTTVDKLLFPGD